jgi:hypothetical protein
MTWLFLGGGKEEDKKENCDHNALYFEFRQGDQLVGDSGYEGEPSKIVVMRDEHSKEFKKNWQEFEAVRKHFSRSSKTGKFSGAILLIEAPLKAGRNCTKWLLKPLL